MWHLLSRPAGSTRIQDCICGQGYYNSEFQNGLNCTACPPGGKCPGKPRATLHIRGMAWHGHFLFCILSDLQKKKSLLHGSTLMLIPGGNATISVEEGYWIDNTTLHEMTSNNVLPIFQCNPTLACASNPNLTCAEGWGGKLCSMCGYDNAKTNVEKKYFLLFGRCIYCVWVFIDEVHATCRDYWLFYLWSIPTLGR